MHTVLVSYGCCNKLPSIRSLKTTQHLLSCSFGGKKFKIESHWAKITCVSRTGLLASDSWGESISTCVCVCFPVFLEKPSCFGSKPTSTVKISSAFSCFLFTLHYFYFLLLVFLPFSHLQSCMNTLSAL